jgi:hypothetical protein
MSFSQTRRYPQTVGLLPDSRKFSHSRMRARVRLRVWVKTAKIRRASAGFRQNSRPTTLNGSALKLFLSHYTKDTIPAVGTNSARTLWSDSLVSQEDNIQDLSQLYDQKVAATYDQLWAEIMVPKLDQIHAVDAPIHWWDTDVIVCSRQILWMLGDRLVAKFGTCYQSFSDSLHVYAALPLPSQDYFNRMGDNTAVFWPQAQLPSAVVSRMILGRYQWMMNEVISSIVGLCLAVDDLVLNLLLLLGGPLNVTKLPAVARLPCIPPSCGIRHLIRVHACLGLPLFIAVVIVAAIDILFSVGRFDSLIPLFEYLKAHG